VPDPFPARLTHWFPIRRERRLDVKTELYPVQLACLPCAREPPRLRPSGRSRRSAPGRLAFISCASATSAYPSAQPDFPRITIVEGWPVPSTRSQSARTCSSSGTASAIRRSLHVNRALPATAHPGTPPAGTSFASGDRPRKCRARRQDSQACGCRAIRGGFVCRVHSGAAPQVRAKANVRLEPAWIYRQWTRPACATGRTGRARSEPGSPNDRARLIPAQTRPLRRRTGANHAEARSGVR
jgi:hypothetical protein